MRLRSLRTIVATAFAVAALTAVLVTPATAIRFGTNDGNDHPYVGLMVAQDQAGKPLWRCTGTLLSSTVFLTAGHCVEAPAAHIEIWFSAGPEPLGAGYPAAGANPCAGITGYPCTGDVGGAPHSHPQWDPDHFWVHVDADVLDDTVMPAVDYRQRGGLFADELATILAAAMATGRVAGVEVTIYNPALDPAGAAGAALTGALARGLGGGAPSPSTVTA